MSLRLRPYCQSETPANFGGARSRHVSSIVVLDEVTDHEDERPGSQRLVATPRPIASRRRAACIFRRHGTVPHD